ncbi:hypothetical protein Syun_005184 [Stephania yunnanensis]|uniref:Mei2-like C-terminal RNA recognition motif domain-containing protein n=1 Tax=Stephania yunnanensis TaxID=152371 RepID=A0AAP0L5S9_9MAGN
MDHSSSQPSISISELDSHCGGPGGPATANEPAHEEQSMVTKNDIMSGGAGQAAAATHTMLRSGFPRVRDGRRTAWKAKSVTMSHDGPDGSEPAASHGFESEEPARCTKTTVMIKNIPNRFTRETLLEIMDDYCRSENQRGVHAISTTAYDFLYLPIDFWSKANKGYAFVNFTTPTAAWSFRLFFTKYKWDLHNSKKICEVTYARIQGKDAMIEHFRSTVFPCTTDEYLPVYFEPSRDGSTKLVKQCVVGKAVSSLGYKT